MTKGLPFKVTQVFWMLVSIWDQYDLIFLQGGTSSSKTYSVMQWLILKAVEQKRTITVVGQDLPNLKVGPIRDLEEIFDSSTEACEWLVGETFNTGFNKSSSICSFKNGSVIEFKSYDSPQDAKSGKRDIAFFNEVNGIPKGIFDEIHDRTKEKTIADFNPTSKFWAHEMLNEPGVIRLISNFQHNEFIPEKTKQKILRYKKTNKYRWRVYGLGLTGKVEGVIFPDVEFISAEQYPGVDKLEKYGYGLDYGYSNDPMAMVDAGLYKGDIYARALIYETGLRLTSLVKRFEDMEVDKWDIISMDDSQAKEQADLLRDDHSYFVKSANRKGGSILSGIGLLQDYFIYIVDTSNGDWQTEQENYKWAEKLGESIARPVDKYNHLWDALRYWALEMLTEPDIDDFDGQSQAV